MFICHAVGPIHSKHRMYCSDSMVLLQSIVEGCQHIVVVFSQPQHTLNIVGWPEIRESVSTYYNCMLAINMINEDLYYTLYNNYL